MSFVVVPNEAQVRLPRNEARLLAEALFQYGVVPTEVPAGVGAAPAGTVGKGGPTG